MSVFTGAVQAAAVTKGLTARPVKTSLTLTGDERKVLIPQDMFSGTKQFEKLKRPMGNISLKGARRPAPAKGLYKRGKGKYNKQIEI